jgi:DNA uptake protein ComE-like DNA-binding protein
MKNFFSFNFSQRNGIVFLSLIVIFIFFCKNTSRKHTQLSHDFSAYKEDVSRLREVTKNKKYTNSSKDVFFPIKPLKESQKISVEVNSADTLDFESLPAIGVVFAKRMCKYRHLLGGYNSIDQLKEVYGMDSLRYAIIKPYLTIDSNNIKSLNINLADVKDLRRHPYISHKLANAIVSYKRQHGVYKTLTDLLNLHLIDSLKFRKIAPYLTTDEIKPVSETY